MDRTVVFVGTHSWSTVDDLVLPDDAEIWCANEAHRVIGERTPSRIFQIHPRDWRERERKFLNDGTLPEGVDADCFGRNGDHVAYLRRCDIPVYAQQIWPDIPSSVLYPFARVTGALGIPLPPYGARRLWATSTFGYMAALALTEHLEGAPIAAIGLAGIELPVGTSRERQWEWPNLAYYLGMAAGLGIDIILPQYGTSLLSAPLYAVEGKPQPLDPDHWWCPGEIGIETDGLIYRVGRKTEGVPVA